MRYSPSKTGDSWLAIIFGYGCMTVIFGSFGALMIWLIYWAVSTPHESLRLAKFFGVIWGVGIAGMLVWHGLIWVIRCQTKWVREAVDIVSGLCSFVLMLTVMIFTYREMDILYRRERPFFFAVISCLIFAGLYYYKRWEQKKELKAIRQEELE